MKRIDVNGKHGLYYTFLVDKTRFEAREADDEMWVTEELYTGRYKHAPYKVSESWKKMLWPYITTRIHATR